MICVDLWLAWEGRTMRAVICWRTEGKQTTRKTRCIINTRMYLKIIGWEQMECFYLLQNKDYLLDLGKLIVNLVGP
jgi:hypothetical protein